MKVAQAAELQLERQFRGAFAEPVLHGQPHRRAKAFKQALETPVDPDDRLGLARAAVGNDQHLEWKRRRVPRRSSLQLFQ